MLKILDGTPASVKHGHPLVLDVGMGTGLLSMLAIKAGAQKVVGEIYTVLHISWMHNESVPITPAFLLVYNCRP